MDFIIGNQVLTETVSFTLRGLIPVPRHLETNTPLAQNTAAIVEMLVRSRRAANKREFYIKSLQAYLRRFTEHFPDLSAVTTTDVELFLDQFQNTSSRATWLNRISVLFNFAVRRELLLKNPCNKIDRVSIDRKDPVTLTVEQAKTLLWNCPNYLLPWLALGMFAGIRPLEIMRLCWEHVNLETKTVRVDGKTRARRMVPLEPVVVEILTRCRQVKGRIAPSLSTVRRWKRKARYLIGGKWHIDVLRHTAASMLLAKYGDAGKVATALGNSPAILLTHYNNPQTKEDAERFFALRPDMESFEKAE